MKILLHALGATMGGAMRHLTNFLPELVQQDTKNDYLVLVRESFLSLDIEKEIHIERIPDTSAGGLIYRLRNDLFDLPRRLKREKYDVIVSLTNFGPVWSSVPHIFFQRNPIYYCNYYLSNLNKRQKTETALRRRWALESMKRADLIVTPSHAMAEMIKEVCPQVRNRSFHTLYHGFAKESLQEPLGDKYVKLLEVDGFKLFYPTHPAPHKGFEVLFNMLACLNEEKIEFTLFTTIEYADWPEVVGEYEKQVRELDLNSKVVFMGRVPQRQMGALYEKCDLMVYTSLCESFGFSMIEAMGHGLPIVAAGTTINKEMCGEGALYYPPLDSRAGAEVVMEALKPETSKNLIESGKKRVASFDWSWKRYTSEFIKMIAEVRGSECRN